MHIYFQSILICNLLDKLKLATCNHKVSSCHYFIATEFCSTSFSSSFYIRILLSKTIEMCHDDPVTNYVLRYGEENISTLLRCFIIQLYIYTTSIDIILLSKVWRDTILLLNTIRLHPLPINGHLNETPPQHLLQQNLRRNHHQLQLSIRYAVDLIQVQ